MKNDITLLVILAEDRRSTTLLRRYAEHFVERRRIREVPSPMGRRSGKQFVERNVASLVADFRRRHINMALMVHIDADTQDTAHELRRIENLIESDGQAPREKSEAIAIVVPKRHMETWICALAGVAEGDESYDFKRDPEGRIISNQDSREARIDGFLKDAAEKLYELTRRNAAAPPASLPSLAAAIPELQRLG